MAINARKAAFKILLDIDSNKKYSNLTLNKYLKDDEITPLDRRFIRQLVYGVLENKIYIDYVISTYSKTPIRKINPNILNILRLGIYQIKYLDKVPDSAAVNESVKIAKKTQFKLAGFVNGILRNYIREPNKVKLPSKDKKPLEYLSIKHSFPKWIVESWFNRFGLVFTEELLSASNSIPKLYVRVNTLKTTRDELIDLLEKEDCVCEKGKIEDSIIILNNRTTIENLKSYQKGLFTVQDASSMLVARVLDPKTGQLVIDMCCAPGGKTTHIAQLMENEGKIIARDIYEHKLHLVEQAAERLGIDIIETELADALVLDDNLIGKADKVLVDAPCSGLGIIKRKPEIKYDKEYSDVEQLADIQRGILKNAAKYVRDGGTLVYSTCTIMNEENEDVISGFLEEHKEFELKNIDDEVPIKTVENKCFGTQLYPNVDATDGFFIAKLIKKSV